MRLGKILFKAVFLFVSLQRETVTTSIQTIKNHTTMKKIMLVFAVLMTFTVSANAMGYEQARQQALFLADKMAYELNLTEEQYEAVYEINLDYLMSVNNEYDLFGDYWRHRNLDLSYVLLDWQYRAFCAASYFYRPLSWYGGYWHFSIYSRYPYRDYFYFGRPHFYHVYRGGHGWHHNGGRSWYHGRSFAPHGGRDHHVGMRTHYDRGGRGGYNGGRGGYNGGRGGNPGRSFDHNNGGNRGGGFNHGGGNRGGGYNGGGNRGGGFNHGDGNRGGGYNVGGNRDGGNRGGGYNGGGSTRSFGGHSSRESSTRTTPTTRSGGSFGGSYSGSRPSGTFSPHSSSSSYGSGSRSFGGSHSSSSFGGSTRSYGAQDPQRKQQQDLPSW